MERLGESSGVPRRMIILWIFVGRRLPNSLQPGLRGRRTVCTCAGGRIELRPANNTRTATCLGAFAGSRRVSASTSLPSAQIVQEIVLCHLKTDQEPFHKCEQLILSPRLYVSPQPPRHNLPRQSHARRDQLYLLPLAVAGPFPDGLWDRCGERRDRCGTRQSSSR